jgi:hypothetical protein
MSVIARGATIECFAFFIERNYASTTLADLSKRRSLARDKPERTDK